jgi:ribosomal protein S6--L-glutamate ligase
MSITENKSIVGSEEWCGLRQLGIPAIKARVDSGAKSSSIHACNIQTVRKHGQLWVQFEVHPIQGDHRTVVRCEAIVIDRRDVKSSSGISEKRYFIRTDIQLGDMVWPIELSLNNRSSMGYRMLLGREAMIGRLMIDPDAHFLFGRYTADNLSRLYGACQNHSSGLRIGILASNKNLYSNRRLIEACEARGHTVMFLNIKQCFMKLDADMPEMYSRDQKVLNNLDAVIPRIRPNLTFYGAALTRHFESMGVFTLNSAQSILQSRDKLFSLQLLIKNGLEIPTTGFANSPSDTQELIDMVGGAPLIIKLLEGTQGTGVVLAETKKAAESVINAMKSLKANLLVQEFIKESAGTDLRCFVVDGKVIASMARIAAVGEYRANVHKGAKTEPVKITSDEKHMVLKAVKTLGLFVAGVDIIRSNKGPLLLEVNSSPGLEGIEAVTGKDIAQEIVFSIEKKLKWSPVMSAPESNPVADNHL